MHCLSLKRRRLRTDLPQPRRLNLLRRTLLPRALRLAPPLRKALARLERLPLFAPHLWRLQGRLVAEFCRFYRSPDRRQSKFEGFCHLRHLYYR